MTLQIRPSWRKARSGAVTRSLTLSAPGLPAASSGLQLSLPPQPAPTPTPAWKQLLWSVLIIPGLLSATSETKAQQESHSGHPHPWAHRACKLVPDQGLLQGHQGSVDGHRDHRQVEIVEHDGDLVVQASPRVEVQAQHAAADHRHPGHVPQPGRRGGDSHEWGGGCPPGLRTATSRPAQPWARVPLCHPCESSALLGKNCLSPGWPGRNRRLGEGKGLTGHGTAATRQSWDSPSAVTPTKVTCNDGTVPRHLSGLDSEARWASAPHLLLYLPPRRPAQPFPVPLHLLQAPTS